MTNDRSSETFEFFEMLAMLGPATFLQELVPPETAHDQYLRFTDQNSREFLLLRILIEVQKSGTVLRRWRTFADDADLTQPREKLGNYERQTLEAYIDEQSMWQRKLTESLVLMINFSTTNTSDYYYHFLLVHELERARRRNQELHHYFGIPRDDTQGRLSEIESKLRRVEDSLGDLASCWYLNGRRLSSFSQRLQSALALATPRERRALGYTYAKGFGEASENIHFSAMKSDSAKPYSNFCAGVAFCGLLTMGILDRAHQLTGVDPSGINRHVSLASPEPTGEDPLSGVGQPGDYVLVDGPTLGVIREVQAGRYGYEAYRVEHIQDEPGRDVTSGWYSALEITPYQGRAELHEGLKQALTEFESQGLPHLDVGSVEMDKAIEQSMGALWQEGVGEYVKRVAERKLLEPESDDTDE